MSRPGAVGGSGRVLPMDQPEAFLKLIEEQNPVISMLASQGAIAGVGNGIEESTKEEEDLGHQQPLYRNSSNDKDAIIFRDSRISCEAVNWNDTTMGKDTAASGWMPARAGTAIEGTPATGGS